MASWFQLGSLQSKAAMKALGSSIVLDSKNKTNLHPVWARSASVTVATASMWSSLVLASITWLFPGGRYCLHWLYKHNCSGQWCQLSFWKTMWPQLVQLYGPNLVITTFLVAANSILCPLLWEDYKADMFLTLIRMQFRPWRTLVCCLHGCAWLCDRELAKVARKKQC